MSNTLTLRNFGLQKKCSLSLQLIPSDFLLPEKLPNHLLVSTGEQLYPVAYVAPVLTILRVSYTHSVLRLKGLIYENNEI